MAVARAGSNPVNDRRWALRSCCDSLCALTRFTIDTEEITDRLIRAVGAEPLRTSYGRVLVGSKLDAACELLQLVRAECVKDKQAYDAERKARKMA